VEETEVEEEVLADHVEMIEEIFQEDQEEMIEVAVALEEEIMVIKEKVHLDHIFQQAD
jgi:hypothetical protein